MLLNGTIGKITKSSGIIVDSLAQAVSELQVQLSDTQNQIFTRQKQLNYAAQKVRALHSALSLFKVNTGRSNRQKSK